MSNQRKDLHLKALMDAPKLAQMLCGSSASDADISMSLNAENRPEETLIGIAGALIEMNNAGTEKKAHRQALAKAARKALNKLAEVPA